MEITWRGHRAILEPELDPEFIGYYNAIVPAIQGCLSYGSSLDEAVSNIKEAIDGCLQDMEAEGE
jgi:predicted RNase H-like HicB family nuclease